jgi:transposase InsO family protein
MSLVEQLHAPEGGGYPVSRLCTLLDVARSGYYRRRTPSVCHRQQARQAEETALVRRLRSAFVASHETYGSRRLTAAVRAPLPAGAGGPVNHKRIERLMRAHGLVPHTVQRFRALSRRAPGQPAAPNHLNQCFVAERLNQVWLVDATAFATHEGTLYLAVVEDLCSRRVVGWATAARFTHELAARALRSALQRRRGAQQTLSGLVHHSDQGAQYTAADYLALLQAAGLTASMSGAGCCYDNAPMESLIGTLKVEWTHPFTYATRRQLECDLFDYIEGFYNPTRLHSALGYRSPIQFEQHYQQQQPQRHTEEEPQPQTC